MKIRMRRNHAVVEEVPERISSTEQELLLFSRAFVRKGRRDGEWDVFMKDEWEPVPEEKWVDVTHEVETRGLGDLYHGQKCIQGFHDLDANGYRLTKIWSGPASHHVAFIVEKRVQ